MQRKTPKQLYDERCGKTNGKVYRWTYQSVKNILVEESNASLLVNHRTETHGRTVTPVPEGEQLRHENFYPVIVERQEWDQVQTMLKANARSFRGNTSSHRYAELLTCGDCGSTFVPGIRCWNGNRRWSISVRAIYTTARSSAHPTASGNPNWMPRYSSTQRTCRTNGQQNKQAFGGYSECGK